MPRNPDIPRADQRYLRCPAKTGNFIQEIEIDSKDWFDWLDDDETRSFAFEGFNGRFTARKESKKRGNQYWYAYRWVNGKTTKAYLGTSDNLTRQKLNEVAVRLTRRQIKMAAA